MPRVSERKRLMRELLDEVLAERDGLRKRCAELEEKLAAAARWNARTEQRLEAQRELVASALHVSHVLFLSWMPGYSNHVIVGEADQFRKLVAKARRFEAWLRQQEAEAGPKPGEEGDHA